jgi:hypothetical protein
MMPAIHLHTPHITSEIFKYLLSIVGGHNDRLADLESLIGNRLDDHFDSEETDSVRDADDDINPEDCI